jgi:hypothetical protein
MKIVIPLSSGDWKLLDTQVRLMEFLGGLRGFEVLFAPSNNVSADLLASGYIERMQAVCRECKVLPINYTEAGSWPAGPNRHWARTAFALDAMGNKEGWFWMELDCWPVVSNWALRLNEEYVGGQKPFMGRIVPTPHKDKVIRADDQMMMGCAVYRHDLSGSWEFRPILDSMVNGVAVTVVGPDKEDPWDLMARGAFKKWGWTATELIGDRWNTMNYRMEGGVLRCDAGPSRFNNIAHTGDDLRPAVCVHGCKDDSLAKLVMSGQYNPSAMPVSVASQSTSPTPAATSALDGKSLLQALCGRTVTDEEFINFRDGVEILIKGEWRQKNEPAPANDPTPTGAPPEAKVSPQDVIPRLELLMRDGNVRVKKLMEISGMDRESITKILDANGYSVAGVSQWIRKKTAV